MFLLLHFYVSNLFCYCSAIFLYLLIFLILGVIMQSVASTLSMSLAFYHSSRKSVFVDMRIHIPDKLIQLTLIK